MLDDPSKSSSEIMDGLVLPLEDGLKELMFPFSRTEHRYWETNAAHNSRVDRSPWEFVEPGQGGPLQAGREHFA